MRYILDTNSTSEINILKGRRRGDVCVLNEVLEEKSMEEDEKKKILSYGVQIKETSKIHLEKLKFVMSENGSNFKLIRLYSNKGAGDLMLLAFILAERENADLFTEDYTLVTTDKELTKIAKGYDIACVRNT